MACIELRLCVCVIFCTWSCISIHHLHVVNTNRSPLKYKQIWPCNTEITQTTASMSIITSDAISPCGTEWMNRSSISHTWIVTALLRASASGPYLSLNVLTETKYDVYKAVNFEQGGFSMSDGLHPPEIQACQKCEFMDIGFFRNFPLSIVAQQEVTLMWKI